MKEDFTGKRFNRLVVVKYLNSDKRGSRLWECICDCGKTKVSSSYYLNAKIIQSCGCLREESRSNRGKLSQGKIILRDSSYGRHALQDGFSRLNKIKNDVAAKRRQQPNSPKREWTIPDEDSELSQKLLDKCTYCGIKASEIGELGLDRYNSQLGYHKNNVVVCCKMCNRAKSDMSYQDFLKWLKRISKQLLRT